MDALLNLPDRGCFGAIERFRAVQDGSAYICCRDTFPSADTVITNSRQQLHDLYKKSYQRSSAAAVVAKRQARQRLDERNSKRQQVGGLPAVGGAGVSAIDAALAAVAGTKNSSLHAAGAAAVAAPGGGMQAAGNAAWSTLGGATNAVTAAVTAVRSKDGFVVPSAHALPQQETTAAAGRQQGGSGTNSSRQTMFTADELKTKTNKELVELLRARSCPVSGSKTDLIRRLLDYQRRVKKAQR